MKVIKILPRLLVILLCSYQETKPATLDHLDLVMLIDKHVGQLGMPDEAQAAQADCGERAITTELMKAIQDGLSILASGHLLNNIILDARDPNNPEVLKNKTHFREVFGLKDCISDPEMATLVRPLIDKIKNFYHIYLPKNVAQDSNFVLLLPKTMNPSEVGFNPNNIELTSYSDLEPLFKKRYKPPFNQSLITEPNITKNLEALFSSTNVLPKRIYLSGHGTHGQIIANLNKTEYQALLKLFNTIHCQFLFVTSCFAGGKNLVEMHEHNTEEQKIVFSEIKESPQFIIAVGSITDQPTTVPRIKTMLKGLVDFSFNKFFDALNRYFTAWGKEKPKLKEVFKFVVDGNLLNMPSIRYPGIQDFFRPAYVDNNVNIITLVSQRAHILEQKLKKIKKEPVKQLVTLSIVTLSKINLIYPPIVEAPIGTLSKEPICFVSMISGPAIHIIKELIVTFMSLTNVVASLIGITGKSPKAYFIQELKCKNYTGSNISENNDSELLKIKNFALMAQQVSRKNLNLTAVFQRSTSWGDIAYQLNFSSALESPIVLGNSVDQVHDIAKLLTQNATISRISEYQFRYETDKIFRSTLPKAEAVRQSLGIVNAQEVLEQIEKYRPKGPFTQKSVSQELEFFTKLVPQKKDFKDAIESARFAIKNDDPDVRRKALGLFIELVKKGQAFDEAINAAQKLKNDKDALVREKTLNIFLELVENGQAFEAEPLTLWIKLIDEATNAAQELKNDKDRIVREKALDLFLKLVKQGQAFDEANDRLVKQGQAFEEDPLSLWIKLIDEATNAAQELKNDKDTLVREKALYLFIELVKNGQALDEAKKAAQELENDENEHVRKKANELLQELKKVKPN